MIIEKLIIYGFGKHENRIIDVDPQMTLFYGPNEAGKTTIQQFIIQTLFGYPARNQSKIRYEPKSGGKYGGQIHLTDSKFGRVVIERIKGKSAGDVTVYFEDGTRGGEAELKLILRDYDRPAFESVFSFSIHELQGLERMTEEELSRTLLASGTTGIDAITKMESQLEKEMGLLFKKTGRNPEMNLLIEELRELEKELKDYRAETELYGPYVERIREIKSRLVDSAQEETAIVSNMRSTEKRLQSLPLLEKAAVLEQQLSQLENKEFPPDGRRRMDKLQDRLSETAAKIEFTQNELEELSDDAFSPQHLEELERMLNRESEWHQLQTLHRQKREQLIQFQDDEDRLVNLVGMPLEQALACDISLNREDQLISYVQEWDLEEEEKRFANRKLAEEKSNQESIKTKIDALMQHQPSEKERQEAEQWPALALQLAEAKAAKRFEKAASSRTPGFLLIGLGLAALLIGIIQGNYIIAGLALLAAAAGAWFSYKNNPGEKFDVHYEKLLEKYAGRETEMDGLVQRIKEHDYKLAEAQGEFEASKRKAGRLSQESFGQPAKQAYEQFLQQLGIDPSSSRATVLDLFEKLREIHALNSGIERLKQDLEKLAERLEEWVRQAEALLGYSLSQEGLYGILRNEFGLRQKQQSENLNREEKRQALETELKELQAFWDQTEKDKLVLLAEAQASDVPHFYKLAEEAAEKETISHELAPLRTQLEAIGEEAVSSAQSLEELKDYLMQQDGLLAELKNERNNLLAELAEKQQMAKNLLADGTYEDTLQQFEAKKTEFAELAKSWAINKAITEAIKQTMDELKEKRLPSVIADAASYFSKLTAGTYTELEMNPAGFFEAVREDGMRFHIAELSQATKEQAYIALRLALAVSMRESHPFPIVMDDAFVHFDRSRLQQMINLITELQVNHQFLYFTCHDTMQQAWPNAHVVHVANTERSVLS